MGTIVYCTKAADAAAAAIDANENLSVAGWRPADGTLPNGDASGSSCDKDPEKKHWLLTDDPVSP